MAEQRLTKKQKYWVKHLDCWSHTGESLSGYASRCGLKSQTLYAAKGRLIARGLWTASGMAPQEPRFVRVEVPAVRHVPRTCQVHLPNGARVEVTVGDEGLESVLRSVAAL